LASPQLRWIGIDVGGRRKGFHVAGVDGALRTELAAFAGPDAVARVAGWAEARQPSRIAIDSPATWALEGEGSRPCEREFARARICGIRFTPDERTAAARTDGYYEWIAYGLELWEEMGSRGLPLIECFPTASWTQWIGARDSRTRARWTRDGLNELDRQGTLRCEQVGNQDERDAVAAALTALQYEHQPMQKFGPLTVPYAGMTPIPDGRQTSAQTSGRRPQEQAD